MKPIVVVGGKLKAVLGLRLARGFGILTTQN